MRGCTLLSVATDGAETVKILIETNNEDVASQLVEDAIVLFRKYEAHPTLNFREFA